MDILIPVTLVVLCRVALLSSLGVVYIPHDKVGVVENAWSSSPPSSSAPATSKTLSAFLALGGYLGIELQALTYGRFFINR
jgi:hypothetical protein